MRLGARERQQKKRKEEKEGKKVLVWETCKAFKLHGFSIRKAILVFSHSTLEIVFSPFNLLPFASVWMGRFIIGVAFSAYKCAEAGHGRISEYYSFEIHLMVKRMSFFWSSLLVYQLTFFGNFICQFSEHRSIEI
jgi:hypothetical protein